MPNLDVSIPGGRTPPTQIYRTFNHNNRSITVSSKANFGKLQFFAPQRSHGGVYFAASETNALNCVTIPLFSGGLKQYFTSTPVDNTGSFGALLGSDGLFRFDGRRVWAECISISFHFFKALQGFAFVTSRAMQFCNEL